MKVILIRIRPYVGASDYLAKFAVLVKEPKLELVKNLLGEVNNMGKEDVVKERVIEAIGKNAKIVEVEKS